MKITTMMSATLSVDPRVIDGALAPVCRGLQGLHRRPRDASCDGAIAELPATTTKQTMEPWLGCPW